MILTSLEQWLRWAGEFTALPYIVSWPLEEDRPLTWELAWRQSAPESFVLESGKGGRYTFIGLAPVSTIRGTVEQAVVTNRGVEREQWTGKPLQLVKRWMEPYRSPKVDGAPKWIGGCIGFWGYDVIRSIERIPVRAKADLTVPDYAFMRIEELWIIDHAEKTLYCAVHSVIAQDSTPASLKTKYEEAAAAADRMKAVWDRIVSVGTEELTIRRLERMQAAIREDRLEIDVDAIEGIAADFEKEQYIEAVRKIQSYIGAGDVFQVNLSVRQHKSLKESPEVIYEWLRLVNPSPYMGLLRFADFQLVSGSPELLVQVEKDEVRTRPIAGTRPRGANAEEDRRLASELIAHEKERAEHIMLVDLERNDLGRISTYGTVRVRDFMVIEYYSHVMHIVSQVDGKLAEGRDAFDVIAATFPGGTITGAPKIRTMEIIEELEPVRRGPYTGSIGWIDYNGDMEFNIIIRTLVVSDGIGYVQAGAGIVIDSVPEKEYTESINKAKAMWKAIQYSEQSGAAAGGRSI
ncbi:Aminodeoxychorismate synthase component 1 [Paenibacillus allorhizosphaerae]|uniref:Aminodeoxychorismate synthase component 1 n=1 Tax=Paenibacillus allorhizosphaerae TaxID=2849866 RepID=A0ABM8VS99_9BACL|nr:anthranilate synthase component I family protein [Paenibacillus allorhizosphaerae]CAG7656392.1 Aminodeoxychorismate synthase component 1 [Paenibacillus allorhizosphaerae]